MHIVDQYAYGNRLTSVNPAYKAGLALIVILLCLSLNHPLVGLTALVWMAGMTVLWAKVPAHVFAKVLLAEVSFLLLTTVGIAISVSLNAPDLDHFWGRQVGPFWLTTSSASLYQASLLVSRAIGAASALNFLAFTTPLVDIVVLLRWCRLPEALIDVMVIMARFIFVLLDTLTGMVTAQESRLGYHAGYRRGMSNAAHVGARLFVNATQRSQRLETALRSRGYGESIRVITPTYKPFPHYWLTLSTVILSLSTIYYWVH
ncbi:MAG: cobalt ECF transporter T component CbiQ [Chloroflexota bacterium]